MINKKTNKKIKKISLVKLSNLIEKYKVKIINDKSNEKIKSNIKVLNYNNFSIRFYKNEFLIYYKTILLTYCYYNKITKKTLFYIFKLLSLYLKIYYYKFKSLKIKTKLIKNVIEFEKVKKMNFDKYKNIKNIIEKLNYNYIKVITIENKDNCYFSINDNIFLVKNIRTKKYFLIYV